MSMERRTFLKGLLTISAAALSPIPAFASHPVLYADGVGDDTIALQALADGKPAIIEGALFDPKVEHVVLRNATLRTTDTVTFRQGSPSRFSLFDCAFNADFAEDYQGPVLMFEHATDVGTALQGTTTIAGTIPRSYFNSATLNTPEDR